MDSKVFVSYSRKDTQIVRDIVSKIDHELGIQCWIDLKGIESSTEFRDVIIKAIDNAEIVLFMLSDNSMASPFAKKEILYAKDTKRIVTICLGDTRPIGWFKFEFAGVDYIRATNEDQMQKLIHDMEGWLGIQAIGPVLKELSKLYEDWEKLEHEQAGILQHVIEKERSIGNRDISTSERIKSQYIKEETYNKLLQEKDLLKRENDELKKQVKELHVLKEQNLSLTNDNLRLIEDIEELKKSQANTSQPSIRSTIGSFLRELNYTPANETVITNGSRHHIFGKYLTFYKLEYFYYCWLPMECSKDEWMRINKKDFEEKKNCTVDLPTVQELNDILKNGSHKPNFHVYWVKDEGRIRAYRHSKKSFSSDDRANLVVIARKK